MPDVDHHREHFYASSPHDRLLERLNSFLRAPCPQFTYFWITRAQNTSCFRVRGRAQTFQYSRILDRKIVLPLQSRRHKTPSDCSQRSYHSALTKREFPIFTS